MDLAGELAAAFTESLREGLAELAESDDIRSLITASSLVTLRKMARTVVVNDSGDLVFESNEHEEQWKSWRTGSTKENPIPVERDIGRYFQQIIDSVIN